MPSGQKRLQVFNRRRNAAAKATRFGICAGPLKQSFHLRCASCRDDFVTRQCSKAEPAIGIVLPHASL
eukprot:601965-Amphidinium_carterae.1